MDVFYCPIVYCLRPSQFGEHNASFVFIFKEKYSFRKAHLHT